MAEVDEHDTCWDRGRMTSLECKQVMELFRLSVDRLTRIRRRLRCGRLSGRPLAALARRTKRNRAVVAAIGLALLRHFRSYNNVFRPNRRFALPALRTPWLELSALAMDLATRFYREQFEEICDVLLPLMPDVVYSHNYCKAPKKLAIFIVLRRWTCPGTWHQMESAMRMNRTWLVTIYTATVRELDIAYKQQVTVLDVLRYKSSVRAAAATIEAHTEGTPGVVAWTDGVGVQCMRPGSQQFVNRLNAMATSSLTQDATLNLLQRAWYNGYYGFAGLKLLHLLLFDSIVYCSPFRSLRQHDNRVWVESSLPTQMRLLSLPATAGSPAFTARVVTDQAFAASDTVVSHTRTASLRRMNPARRQIAEETDTANNTFRICTEHSFAEHRRWWPHSAFYKTRKLFQNGEPNVEFVGATWRMQVLFSNLRTCHYHGLMPSVLQRADDLTNPVLTPPSPHEYMANINAGRHLDGVDE